MAETKKNYFEDLYNLDVSGKTEQKNGLTYLSWAFAWAELKKKHPMSYYTVYEDKNENIYHNDGRTCWVKTGVTVVFDDEKKLEHIEYLPVMDFKNKSIPVDNITSMDANKAIQRSLTKAAARHGVGLFVYAGEDLPEEAKALANAMEEAKAKIIDLCKDLAANGKRDAAYAVIEKTTGNKNPNAIKDPAVAENVLAALAELKSAKK